MSARFDNAVMQAGAQTVAERSLLRHLPGAMLALALAGCGGTTPTKPAPQPVAVTQEAAADAQAAAAEPTRAERRAAERKAKAERKAEAERQARAERQAGAERAATAEPDERSRRSRRGRDDEAPADGEPADAGVPEAALAAYEQALAAMQAENWTEAELDLEQLVLEYENLPGPYVNLAIVYAHDGRDDEAREALEKALAIDPGHAAANNQLGMLLRREGDFPGAETAYRKAIETDPDYMLAYYNLGVLLDLYLRRQDEALEYYQKYQDSLAEPDQQVGRWIIDLRRRLGVVDDAARVANEDGS